jgi:hypothetical protein
MSILSAISNINWWAVLVAWGIHVVLSLVWFQPFLFGKAWVKLCGKDMDPAKQWFPVGLLAHLVYIFVLAVILNLADARSVIEGIALGLQVSICFISTMLGGELVWEKIPFSYSSSAWGIKCSPLALRVSF